MTLGRNKDLVQIFINMFRTIKRIVTPRRWFSSSNTGDSTPRAYATGVQVMHWLMGGSMMASVGLVINAQKTKDKKLKSQLMFYHKSFGLLSFGLLFPRAILRAISRSPGSVPGSSTIEHFLAQLSHLAMYGFIVGLPVTGTVMAAYGGYGMPFFYTTFPSVDKKPSIANPAYDYHKLMGSVFIYMVPLHIGGALYHVIRGQPIFVRILGIIGKA